MATTSTRTLRLLSLLQTHRFWPGAELAARLHVSVRTLRRDVDRLRELGYPVEARRGTDGGYQLAPGAALPPLVIDDDEAVALAVGLQATTQGAVDGIAESSLRVLAKVVQVMPARLRRRVDALRAMTVHATWGGSAGTGVDPGVLTTVALACRDTERLDFSYTAADGRCTERHVEPHRLVCLGRRWYLVAYDTDRQDWRTFRVDRLAAPHSTGVRFRPRDLPAADAAAFVRAGMAKLPRPYRVEVLVDASAETVRQRVGRWVTVEEGDGGPCRVRMVAESLDWPVMVLGAVGCDFRVVSPPELVDRAHAWAARLDRVRDARHSGHAPDARTPPGVPDDQADRGHLPAGRPT